MSLLRKVDFWNGLLIDKCGEVEKSGDFVRKSEEVEKKSFCVCMCN